MLFEIFYWIGFFLLFFAVPFILSYFIFRYVIFDFKETVQKIKNWLKILDFKIRIETKKKNFKVLKTDCNGQILESKE